MVVVGSQPVSRVVVMRLGEAVVEHSPPPPLVAPKKLLVGVGVGVGVPLFLVVPQSGHTLEVVVVEEEEER